MIELNKIYCENNLETMARMPDGFVDLVVTSPPYGDLRAYNGFSFDFEGVAKELFRIVKDGGVVVWITSDETINGSESLVSFKQAIGFVEHQGFILHDTMIWSKGSFAFPSRDKYHQSFEYMFVFSKGKPKTFNPISDRKNIYLGTRGASGRGKDGVRNNGKSSVKSKYGMRMNVFNYPIGGGHSSDDDISYNHPAIFPEDLAKDHIYSWSNEGDLVYDPFMGSGTTAKMAHLLKRNWIGSEISQAYVDLANKRLKPYLTQERLEL